MHEAILRGYDIRGGIPPNGARSQHQHLIFFKSACTRMESISETPRCTLACKSDKPLVTSCLLLAHSSGEWSSWRPSLECPHHTSRSRSIGRARFLLSTNGDEADDSVGERSRWQCCPFSRWRWVSRRCSRTPVHGWKLHGGYPAGPTHRALPRHTNGCVAGEDRSSIGQLVVFAPPTKRLLTKRCSTIPYLIPL